jgi:hypothetical protein
MIKGYSDLIARANSYAAYCYEAARLCPPGRDQQYFLWHAERWELLARNVKRDTSAISESRALLAQIEKLRL